MRTVFTITITAAANAEQIAYDAATDGCFPLTSSADKLIPAEVLKAYRYQPKKCSMPFLSRLRLTTIRSRIAVTTKSLGNAIVPPLTRPSRYLYLASKIFQRGSCGDLGWILRERPACSRTTEQPRCPGLRRESSGPSGMCQT